MTFVPQRVGWRNVCRVKRFLFLACWKVSLLVAVCAMLLGMCVEANWLIRHPRHWTLGVWPEVPGGPWAYHSRSQRLSGLTLLYHDVILGCNFDEMNFYKVDAAYLFKDQEYCANVARYTPDFVMNHHGRPSPTRHPWPHSFSIGRFVMRRDYYILPFSAAYYWESATTVTVVRIPAYVMLLLGGGPVGYWLANLMKRRIRSRRILARGFDVGGIRE